MALDTPPAAYGLPPASLTAARQHVESLAAPDREALLRALLEQYEHPQDMVHLNHQHFNGQAPSTPPPETSDLATALSTPLLAASVPAKSTPTSSISALAASLSASPSSPRPAASRTFSSTPTPPPPRAPPGLSPPSRPSPTQPAASRFSPGSLKGRHTGTRRSTTASSSAAAQPAPAPAAPAAPPLISRFRSHSPSPSQSQSQLMVRTFSRLSARLTGVPHGRSRSLSSSDVLKATTSSSGPAAGAAAPSHTNKRTLSSLSSPTTTRAYWCTSCGDKFLCRTEWARHDAACGDVKDDEESEEGEDDDQLADNGEKALLDDDDDDDDHHSRNRDRRRQHRHRLPQRAWACGFCAAFLGSADRYHDHVAAHFERGQTLAHWHYANVIYGLLHQPVRDHTVRAQAVQTRQGAAEGAVVVSVGQVGSRAHEGDHAQRHHRGRQDRQRATATVETAETTGTTKTTAVAVVVVVVVSTTTCLAVALLLGRPAAAAAGRGQRDRSCSACGAASIIVTAVIVVVVDQTAAFDFGCPGRLGEHGDDHCGGRGEPARGGGSRGGMKEANVAQTDGYFEFLIFDELRESEQHVFYVLNDILGFFTATQRPLT
ncbi:hypothetical protein SPI_03679 [Niveomyces insectorum RCEF 264]|uniref:C2H2-type domain-containing protein n=1 Tax=Niveomyces insectorum RCEF 264 TaxID=1081102 RepID=A0A167W9X7_9HYPO|nr:hypothetical protein SPI_03679 [Niveomyces insectorum RCEF 264]